MTFRSQDERVRTVLGNHLRIRHGFAFKGELFKDNGPYIVLTPGNFRDEGGFKSKEPEKYYAGDPPAEYVLSRGDLIVAMTEQSYGLLGSAAFVPEDDLYLHNQRLGLVVDLDEGRLDKRYLYYLMNTASVRNQLQATATGSKVRHTAPSRIESVEVSLPRPSVQRRIAEVLSSYDDLIGDNARRIEILEEMAQAIYREWCVNFRFPGYEDVEMVASELGPIPQGWAHHHLGDVSEQVRRNVDPTELDPATPYVGLGHIPRETLALDEWGRAEEVKSTKLAFRKGEILFGKIRPYFHKVVVAPVDGICSSDTIVIKPVEDRYWATILFTVSSRPFVDLAAKTAQGTKMPRANWDVMAEYPVVIPPTELLGKFSDHARTTVDLIHNLLRQNRVLRETRDLLRPKLISGEISVEHLDSTLEEAVA